MKVFITALLLFGAAAALRGVDYSDYNRLLGMAVKDGLVNYQLLSKPKNRAALARHLRKMEKINPASLSTNEAKAFLIHYYNAATLSLIVANYPLKSIRDLPSPWESPLYKVAGKKYTLNQIQYELLLEPYRDARIHFLLNCSAISCPRLLPYAPTGDNIDSALEDAAVAFVNYIGFNRFEFQGDRLTARLSELFFWYEKDFVAHYGSVKAALSRFVKDQKAASVLSSGNYKTERLLYDWSLNEKP